MAIGCDKVDINCRYQDRVDPVMTDIARSTILTIICFVGVAAGIGELGRVPDIVITESELEGAALPQVKHCAPGGLRSRR